MNTALANEMTHSEDVSHFPQPPSCCFFKKSMNKIIMVAEVEPVYELENMDLLS